MNDDRKVSGNPLAPRWHHAKGSLVPTSNGVPVRLMADAGGMA